MNINICAEERAPSLIHNGSRPEPTQGMNLVTDVFVREILTSNKETRVNTAVWPDLGYVRERSQT